jgi:hypothetical protein
MRKVKRGGLSISDAKWVDVERGDSGLRVNGLKRFAAEEAQREAEERKKANVAAWDALITVENGPVLAARCPMKLRQFSDDEASTLLVNAWDRFEKRRISGLREDTRTKIKALFRKLVFLNFDVDWFSPGNSDNTFDAVWGYLVELGILERLGFGQPAPAPKRVDPIESMNGETRQGNEAMKNAVYDDVFSKDIRSVFEEFVVWLRKTFSHELGDFQSKWIMRFITDNNLPWLDGESWTRARVAAVKKGVLPLALLTEDERLTWKIEDETTPLSDWETQQKYLGKLHRTDTVEAPVTLRSSGDVRFRR